MQRSKRSAYRIEAKVAMQTMHVYSIFEASRFG
jgi:hypothetical protein